MLAFLKKLFTTLATPAPAPAAVVAPVASPEVPSVAMVAKQEFMQAEACVGKTEKGLCILDWLAVILQQGSPKPNQWIDLALPATLPEAGPAIYAAALELARKTVILEGQLADLQRELEDRKAFTEQQSALVATQAAQLAAARTDALALQAAMGLGPICPCNCPSCARNISGDLGAVCWHNGVAVAGCGGH